MNDLPRNEHVETRPPPLLVVLLDTGLREALTSALRREGFGVVVTSTTSQAMAYLRKEGRAAPRAVVYDLVEADGKDLQQALAAAPRLADIPQLAFASATEHRALKAYVEVPISLTDLLQHLRRITGTLQ